MSVKKISKNFYCATTKVYSVVLDINESIGPRVKCKYIIGYVITLP